jgi:hypothetical protein
MITNLAKEQRKFLFDQKYNPQFEYDGDFDDSILEKYDYHLSEDILKRALEIMQRVLKTYDTEEKFLDQEGPNMTRAEVESQISEYLKKEDLHNRVKVVSSSNFIARTSVANLQDHTFQLRLRLPYDYRKETLVPVLSHEVGTHVMRWINEFQQPWYKHRRDYGMKEYLSTEEGLAVLNAMLFHPAPYFWLPAVYYFAAYNAQTKSFSEVCNLLKPYVANPERRWKIALRVKRGLKDTSEPGGYKKDLVYLNGILEVAEWLRTHNYAAKDLYLGKIHCDDIEKAKSFSALTEYAHPSFLNDPQYDKKIEKILKLNGV